MQKKKGLAFCCAIVFVILMCLTLFACDKKGDTSSHSLNLDEGSFPDALPANFQGEEQQTITSGLQTGASVDDVKKAVFAMYNVANRSRKSADLSLMVQHTESGSGISAMTFNGFEVKSGNAWYYQLPREAAWDALSNTQVAYTLDSETFYYAKLDSSSMAKCTGINTFPYASFLLISRPVAYNFDDYKKHRFFLDDQLELCNMKMMLDLIDETSEISFDATNHVYTVKLVVDCEDGDPDLLKEWAAMAQEEANSESSVERKYKYWYADFEVWENGYIKSLNYEEYWQGKIEMGAISFDLDGPASSQFKFFYDEEEIMAILQQDPKYSALAEEDKDLMTTPLSFIEMYCGAEITAAGLVSWHIALIVISCVIFAVIVVVVGIEIAVKKGRLPKLAAKRAAAKEKRLEKKNKKKGIASDEVHAEQNGDDDLSAYDKEQTDDVQNNNQSESDSSVDDNE